MTRSIRKFWSYIHTQVWEGGRESYSPFYQVSLKLCLSFPCSTYPTLQMSLCTVSTDMKMRFFLIFAKTNLLIPSSGKYSFSQSPLSRCQFLMGGLGSSFLPAHFHNYGTSSWASFSYTCRLSLSSVTKIAFFPCLRFKRL